MAGAARTALVTGANRGIGLAVCRQLAAAGLRVVLTARGVELGETALAELRDEGGAGGDIRFEKLDVADEASVRDCAARLHRAAVTVDVLINNAGIYPPGLVLDAKPSDVRAALDVNFLGAWWCCQAWVPGMLERGYGRVVNVSSGYGAFAEGLEGPAPYSLSKAALNALTLKLCTELSGDVKVNACCPGWVQTEMGGPGADVTVDAAADGIVWLATLPRNGPNGGFFRHRERIEW